MFVIVAHCVFLPSPPSITVLTLLILHNEIHPSQLGGVAVCCGMGAQRMRVCVLSLLNWGFTRDKQLY